jgi:hypothetical protein
MRIQGVMWGPWRIMAQYDGTSKHSMGRDYMANITTTQHGGMVQHDMAWDSMTHITTTQHSGTVHHGRGPHDTHHYTA